MKTTEALVSVMNLVGNAIGGAPNPYGLTQAQLGAIDAADAQTTTAIAAQTTAFAAAKAATQAKITAKKKVVLALNAAAAAVYANPVVTDTMLATIGFAPRRPVAPRPALPQTPTDVAAIPAMSGTVKVSWGRNGNSNGATFLIESSADGVVVEKSVISLYGFSEEN